MGDHLVPGRFNDRTDGLLDRIDFLAVWRIVHMEYQRLAKFIGISDSRESLLHLILQAPDCAETSDVNSLSRLNLMADSTQRIMVRQIGAVSKNLEVVTGLRRVEGNLD